VPILAPALTEKIEIETNLGTNLGTIHGDVGRLEQVIMNLGVNARDAMPDGGTLCIQTYNIDLDENYSEIHQRLDEMPSTGSRTFRAQTDPGQEQVGVTPSRARFDGETPLGADHRAQHERANHCVAAPAVEG
jgi:signal transduction histidine kinase